MGSVWTLPALEAQMNTKKQQKFNEDCGMITKLSGYKWKKIHNQANVTARRSQAYPNFLTFTMRKMRLDQARYMHLNGNEYMR